MLSRPVLIALASFTLIAAALALPREVASIPSTVVHSHTDAVVRFWRDNNNKDPAKTAHNHRSATDFDNLPNYQANKVWDDRTLRFHNDTSVAGGHGFIRSAEKPRYCIDQVMPQGDPFPAAAIPRIVEAFAQWSAIPADMGLLMGLGFERVNPCPAGFIEIRVRFAPIGDLGLTTSAITLDNQGAQIPGAQITDCQPNTAGNQSCLSEVTFQIPETPGFEGAKWEFSADPADTDATEYHFLSVALHEVGHVVGLAHFDNRARVMHIDQKKGCGAAPQGPCFAAIDAASMNGARDLYSIPCPQQPSPTPTPTPAPTPPPEEEFVCSACLDAQDCVEVGGEAGLVHDAAPPAEASGGDGAPLLAPIAAAVAAGAAALAAGGWFLRRRWMR